MAVTRRMVLISAVGATVATGSGGLTLVEHGALSGGGMLERRFRPLPRQSGPAQHPGYAIRARRDGR
jgi:hypothetical protein